MHRTFLSAASLALVLLFLGVVSQASENEDHRILLKLSPSEQNALMTKFMKGADEPDCEVTETFFQGADPKAPSGEGDVIWNVRCANKKAFSVLLPANPRKSPVVTDCQVLKAFAHVECFKKFP